MALVRRAIRDGWPIPENLRVGLVQQMTKVMVRGESERDQIAAARVIVAADSLNVAREKIDQADDLAAMGVGQNQINVNVGVQVVESDDWYGTRAAAESRVVVAEGDGASTGSVAVPRSVQGGGDGSALGENGSGLNGHDKRPRT